MKKIIFKNTPSEDTPIDAESLNYIQDSVEEEINKTNEEMVNLNNIFDIKYNEVMRLSVEVETNKDKVAQDKIEIENKHTEIKEMDKNVTEKNNSVNTTYKNFQQDLGTRVPTLENGKIPVEQIPRIAITETKTFTTTEERDKWLNSQEGDIAIVSSENKSYIKDAENRWLLLESPSDYATNAGHSATSDNASNSAKINGKSIIYMTQSDYDNAYNSDTLLEDTYYFVV